MSEWVSEWVLAIRPRKVHLISFHHSALMKRGLIIITNTLQDTFEQSVRIECRSVFREYLSFGFFVSSSPLRSLLFDWKVVSLWKLDYWRGAWFLMIVKVGSCVTWLLDDDDDDFEDDIEEMTGLREEGEFRPTALLVERLVVDDLLPPRINEEWPDVE